MRNNVVKALLVGIIAISVMGCAKDETGGQDVSKVAEQQEVGQQESEQNDLPADAAGIGAVTEESTASQSSEDESGDALGDMEDDETLDESVVPAGEADMTGDTEESEEADLTESEGEEDSTQDVAEETSGEERELFSGDPLSLSNETIPYGYADADRDENNVPNGVYYYKNLYSKYNADYIQDTSKNLVYLTMDEGYEAGNTPVILQTLKEKGVKAVFFVTKQFVDEHPELVQQMIDEGHIIGNHTCAHPAEGMPSLGYEAEKEDITTLHQMVKDQFGYEMKLFRYPSGLSSEQSLALVQSLGYKSVFWSFAHHDWVLHEQPDEQETLQKCLTSIHPGAIYLLHAVSTTNTHILADFIDGAREKGFEFGVYPVN